MLPPKTCWMLAPKFPTMLRERTTIPRTMPRLRSIRTPSIWNAVVTHDRCTAAGWGAYCCCIGLLLGKADSVAPSLAPELAFEEGSFRRVLTQVEGSPPRFAREHRLANAIQELRPARVIEVVAAKR